MSRFSARFMTILAAMLTGYFALGGNLLEDDRGVSLLLKATAGAFGIVTCCLLTVIVIMEWEGPATEEQPMPSRGDREE